mgnify:CR=1 FL=1
MLILHHAPNTRSVRIVWLLEELGLPYEIVPHRLGDPEMRSPEHLAVNPNGRVPTLIDGEATLFESGAIVEYVLARHGAGRLRPAADSPDFPAYLQWLHYAEGMIMPPVNTIVVETILLPPERRSDANAARARKLLTRTLGAVEGALADGRAHLAGAFSGADVMTGHACTVARRLGADLSALPAVADYVERLNARPAFAKAWTV